jgi:hypothetical protein
MEKDEETEELIKIFVISIKTAVRQAHGPARSRRAEKNRKIRQMILNCGAQRHHYSMLDVGRSMFDVHLLNQPRMA